MESYRELKGKNPELIMLDEIQHLKNWDRFVRTLADKGYKIVLTGSNSKIISREIADRLGGRFLTVRMYPFSFREYLRAKNIKFEEEKNRIKNRHLIKKEFDEYLLKGGFPEVVLNRGIERELLQTYLDLNLEDVVKHYGDNPKILELVFKKVIENIGKEMSVRSIHRYLRSLDIEVNLKRVYEMLDHLENIFIIQQLEPVQKSLKKTTYLRKYYLIDNGYTYLLDKRNNLGAKLENLVFVELKRRFDRIHYYRDVSHECDFIVGNKAIQVVYELNEENLKKGIKGLKKAMDVLGLEEGLILTNGPKREFGLEREGIKVEEVWRWILGS